jgi:ribosomal-protein-alanine N-acetyltransferase
MARYRKAPLVALETARLRLRPLAEPDAHRIQTLFPHPNVLRYMNAAIPWPYPENGAIEFVRSVLPRLEAQEEYYWALRLKAADEGLIGVIGLTPASDEDHRGFWLAEIYWGRGLMREAVAAVNDFAFDVLGMTELLLNNAAPNAASHRLKESVGAEIVRIEDTDYVGGRFPGVRWRLTAEAWRRHRLTP